MAYTLKKYLKELKTNPYWGIEPHFHYYCMIKLCHLFRTVVENKMTSKEFRSAMYGEFEKEGKPVLEGFIQSFNLGLKMVDELIKKNSHQL